MRLLLIRVDGIVNAEMAVVSSGIAVRRNFIVMVAFIIYDGVCFAPSHHHHRHHRVQLLKVLEDR